MRRLVVELTDLEYQRLERAAPTSVLPPDYIRLIVRQVLEYQEKVPVANKPR
jgi:hypothetical protein